MRALGSPWLGVAAIAVAGAIGFARVDDAAARLTLDAVTVTVRATRDSGSPWDFGGGLPDPAVRVEQAGRVLARCAEVKDRVEVRCPVGVRVGGGTIRVIVVDKDTADDDPIGELDVTLPAAAPVRGPGALVSVEVATHGGQGRFARLAPLWLGLAIGVAVALALRLLARRR